VTAMAPITSFNSFSILTGSLLVFLHHLEGTLFNGVQGRQMAVLLGPQITPGGNSGSEFRQLDVSAVHAYSTNLSQLFLTSYVYSVA
jgi:hypothetical protein